MDFLEAQRRRADARWWWNKAYRCIWFVFALMFAQVLLFEPEAVWVATTGFVVLMANDFRRLFSDRRFYRTLDDERRGYLAGHEQGLKFVQRTYRR